MFKVQSDYLDSGNANAPKLFLDCDQARHKADIRARGGWTRRIENARRGQRFQDNKLAVHRRSDFPKECLGDLTILGLEVRLSFKETLCQSAFRQIEY